MDADRDRDRLTTAEASAVAALAAPVSAILAAFVLDLSGVRFAPGLLLSVALAASAGTLATLRRGARPVARDTRLLVVTVVTMAAWLVWLAVPSLLPLSTGPDLTHHLILIRYIEEHWTLVHDPALERFLGEMAQYTPGSHILVALAGAVSRTDGLRAMHALQASTVALKTGFLFLIGVRLLPARAPKALALIGAALLLASPRYFLGPFTEYGFLAQVVAELLVVAMWWAAVAWDHEPDYRVSLAFSLAGAAAFLTWPVYTGPPALAFFIVIGLRSGLRPGTRVRHLLAAFLPLTICAGIYLVGRLGWLQLAGTGGSAPWPSVSAYGWPLVALASGGFAVGAVRRRARASVLFTLAVLAQAAAFLVLAARSGAPQPYMALKMGYLLVWPMTAFGVLAVGEAWCRMLGPIQVRPSTLAARLVDGPASWLTVALALTLAARPLLKTPRLLHPRPPAVSAPLYAAGIWARAHVPPGCIEYLVGDDETAYWLHLAVLGNPRMSDRTGDNATYEPADAVLRWLTPNGLPYAIADLPSLSRDVRDDLDVVERFGSAAVARRRGPAACGDRR